MNATSRRPGKLLRLSHFASLLSLSVIAMTLAGCGFHLRGQANLPFETMYINGPASFTTPLSRSVRAGSTTRLVTNPKEAEVTLQILGEARERSILSLSGAGRVQESGSHAELLARDGAYAAMVRAQHGE